MAYNPQTEIDLWELLLKGWGFFKQRKKVILIFFVLGILYSLSKYFTHPHEYKPYYKREFIAQSSVASDEILADIINDPSLSFTESNSLRKLKAKTEANINKETRLKIFIEAYEKEKFDTILNFLQKRINSITSLKEKFDYQKKQSEQLLAELSKIIIESDSTKTLDYITLMERKQQEEKALALNKIIEFTEINSDLTYVNNFRTVVLNIFGFAFLGIVLGFLFSYILNCTAKNK